MREEREGGKGWERGRVSGGGKRELRERGGEKVEEKTLTLWINPTRL